MLAPFCGNPEYPRYLRKWRCISYPLCHLNRNRDDIRESPVEYLLAPQRGKKHLGRYDLR